MPRRPARALAVACAGLLSAVTPARAALVASVFDGRIPCAAQQGVQFCQGSVATRVESWDGVPLDANLTLPPPGVDGPFPLIVDLHGWSLGKTGTPYVDYAQDGYAVLSYTARGFHESCGSPAGRAPDPSLHDPDVCATRGWTHLGDARYEARDTQYLASLLADEGLVIPDRVGVTGASYGGIQSLILAALKDRIMLPDGTLTAWRSPGGRDLRIAAAAPLIPASDLAYSLTPNGRTLDYRTLNPYGARAGVQKQSWNALLYGVGLTVGAGFYAPPGVDPGADLQTWNTRMAAGEPYDGDSAAQAILDEITSHHSAYYVDDSEAPAPLLIYNAWTDDLFPVDEALRFWRKTRGKHPTAEISLHFANGFGHPRADLAGNIARVQARVLQHFARHLKDSADPPLPALETFTQACGGATEAGPFTAADWDAIHPGEVRYATKHVRRFDSKGGRPETATALDPLAGGPCRTVPAADDPGAATYRLPAAAGAGYTLLGSPTIIADLTVRGGEAQVAGRLWDVAPDGSQTLVAHALYRPRTDNLGPQVFQLHPNGWHFAARHRPKLELLGQSVPYGRASNGTFVVTVRRLELRLPTLEAAGGAVASPAPVVQPPSEVEPPACAPTPRTGCATAGPHASSLTIAGGRLGWRWGTAMTKSEFGSPLVTTGWALCVYDGSPQLVVDTAVPPGGTCGKNPCWTETTTGFVYADRSARSGVRKMVLQTGSSADGGIDLEAQGARLDLSALPIRTLPVTAQLVSSDGTCWSAGFGSARGKGHRFSAVSD